MVEAQFTRIQPRSDAVEFPEVEGGDALGSTVPMKVAAKE
jgi:hypothetical protein